MANQRDIKLDKYNISKYAFRELNYFCLQYHEKKRKVLEGMLKNAADVNLIERTAMEAGVEIYPYLLQAVTAGKSYINLKMTQNVPCGKNYFNKRRRKFYYLLARKKGMVTINHNSEKLDNIIKQLEDLIADRKSFLSEDGEYDEVFLKDIEALHLAIGIIVLVKTL